MRRLLVVTVTVLVAATGYAQTPNEGVCDDLMYSTPGLYGLCIAFCEAQDCEPDFSLEDPFENCNPSSEKLLNNYNRKRQEGDPEMPGIQAPCPCWTQEELDALPFSSFDWKNCTETTVLSVWSGQLTEYNSDNQAIGYDFATVRAVSIENQERCVFSHRCTGTFECPYLLRFFNVTAEEADFCRAQVRASGLERGFDCFE